MKPTKLDVLRAVTTAAQPRSVYINNEIRRWHSESRHKRGFTTCPTPAYVLRQLKECVAEGWLTRSVLPDGLYGYTWTITDAGRAALERSI